MWRTKCYRRKYLFPAFRSETAWKRKQYCIPSDDKFPFCKLQWFGMLAVLETWLLICIIMHTHVIHMYAFIYGFVYVCVYTFYTYLVFILIIIIITNIYWGLNTKFWRAPGTGHTKIMDERKALLMKLIVWGSRQTNK